MVKGPATTKLRRDDAADEAARVSVKTRSTGTVHTSANLDLWTWPRQGQDESACQISTSNVIWLKNYYPDTQSHTAHTHRLDCTIGTTKVVCNHEGRTTNGDTDQFWGQVLGSSCHLERERHQIFVGESLDSAVTVQPGRQRFFIAGLTWWTVLSQKVSEITVRSVFNYHIQRTCASHTHMAVQHEISHVTHRKSLDGHTTVQ